MAREGASANISMLTSQLVLSCLVDIAYLFQLIYLQVLDITRVATANELECGKSTAKRENIGLSMIGTCTRTPAASKPRKRYELSLPHTRYPHDLGQRDVAAVRGNFGRFAARRPSDEDRHNLHGETFKQ